MDTIWFPWGHVAIVEAIAWVLESEAPLFSTLESTMTRVDHYPRLPLLPHQDVGLRHPENLNHNHPLHRLRWSLLSVDSS